MSVIKNATSVHLREGIPAVVGRERNGAKWVTLGDFGGDCNIDLFYEDIDVLRGLLSKVAFAAADLERELRVADSATNGSSTVHVIATVDAEPVAL